MERGQPFGHHQSQRYKLYKRVDEADCTFLQLESAQMLEYQDGEESGQGLNKPGCSLMTFLRMSQTSE